MLAYFRALQRWDYTFHKYRQILIPVNWNCKLYSDNMDEIVNCPHCGKALQFGDTFASIEIHNDLGLGYGVCKECHKEELRRREVFKGPED